jgi:hypothetical protein
MNELLTTSDTSVDQQKIIVSNIRGVLKMTEQKHEVELTKPTLADEVKKLAELKKAYEFALRNLQAEIVTPQSKSYLDSYINNKNSLITAEQEYVDRCNKLRFSEQRLKVLKAVLKLQNKERPLEDNCPSCHQKLPSDVGYYYKHYQNLNDTNAEIANHGKKIKDLQAKIIMSRENMDVLKSIIEKEYSILNLTWGE